MAIWYILRPFSSFVVIWYISSRFGILNRENVAILNCGSTYITHSDQKRSYHSIVIHVYQQSVPRAQVLYVHTLDDG
jgi:hypothetical protein